MTTELAEPQTPSVARSAAVPTALAKPRKSRAWLYFTITVALLIVAALFAGYWYAQNTLKSELAASMASLDKAVADARQIESKSVQEIRVLQEQMAALSASNQTAANEQRRALAELDGINARVDNAVAAVSRAAQAQPSALALKLEEVQFLLTQADERLSFGGDPANAIKALKLAQASLLNINDLSYAGFLPEIEAAIAALRALNAPNRSALAADLAQALVDADGLRLAAIASNTDATGSWRSQLRSELSRYFRIEREGARDSARGLSEAELIAQIKAALRLARLAVLSGDQPTWQAALEGIDPLLAEFDRSGENAARLRNQLARWQGVALNPDAPTLTALVERFTQLKTLAQEP